jgi:hypothetical protein
MERKDKRQGVALLERGREVIVPRFNQDKGPVGCLTVKAQGIQVTERLTLWVACGVQARHLRS